MNKETVIQNKIRCRLSELGILTFRNETGMGYGHSFIKMALNFIKSSNPALYYKVNSIIQKGIIKFGFGQGSSDLIGIKEVLITPEMVGQKIGQFVALETKKPNHKTDKKRLEQQTNFINMIKSKGGLAGFVEDLSQAERIINNG